jgi:hypothetical protein
LRLFSHGQIRLSLCLSPGSPEFALFVKNLVRQGSQSGNPEP